MLDVTLPIFQGPLDLLLHLIEREELDITEVSLVQVTDQYLLAVRAADVIEMAALAEFVWIGSKLLYLKSKALLPRPVLVADDATDEGESEDVAEELTRMLEEYRRYKEVAEVFRERQQAGLRAYPRLAPVPDLPTPLGLDNVTLDRLVDLFREALERQEPETPVAIIERDPVTVQAKIGEIMAGLESRGRIGFRTIVATCRRRVEIVVSFLAVLELIKSGRVVATQPEPFGDIELVPAATAR